MSEDMHDGGPLPTAIVGAGAVGTALARRMAERGHPVEAVLSRREAAAQALAARVDAPVASPDWADLPKNVRFVVLCVPDDAIVDVAGHLSAVDHDWPATIAAHTSGALAAAALAPLEAAGSAVMSFHPLQTFTRESPPSVFEGIHIGVEGDDVAVAWGQRLAESLGARPVVIESAAKTRYHLAASIASNGLVALMGIVEEIVASAGMEARAAQSLVRPLVEQTWRNLLEGRPQDVLTGPVSRGDVDTVVAHTGALAEHTPHLLPVYAALSTEMVRLAVRSGKLEEDRAEALMDRLHAALQSGAEPSH